VRIHAQAGTATDGADYVAENAEVTFESGATDGMYTFAIVDDEAAEVPESLLLELSDPLGCILGSSGTQKVVTIIDDDVDSDGDGLSDADEIVVYGTDPLQTDTDGDGVSDFNEVVFGTDPLDTSDVPSLSSIRVPFFLSEMTRGSHARFRSPANNTQHSLLLDPPGTPQQPIWRD
jgi:hypothetical protein